MSTDRFWIKEHTLPACHVREYPRATVDDGDELHLAIKEYIPKEEKSSSAQGVTVIGAHANGFPKVCTGLWTGCLGATADINIGTLRAIMGRAVSPSIGEGNLHSKYMDR